MSGLTLYAQDAQVLLNLLYAEREKLREKAKAYENWPESNPDAEWLQMIEPLYEVMLMRVALKAHPEEVPPRVRPW
jgi:hypothetical protein